MMRLIRFRVTDFRSIEDSDWIETDTITALIGTNESGKTNVLLPLWKLNPAKDGEINPLADYPRKRYHEFRAVENKPIFIRAQFDLPPDLVAKLVAITGAAAEDVQVAEVARDYSGRHHVTFPKAMPARPAPATEVARLLMDARNEMAVIASVSKADENLKGAVLTAIDAALATIHKLESEIDQAAIETIKAAIDGVDMSGAAKRSMLVPRYGQLADALSELVVRVSRPTPDAFHQAHQLVSSNLPAFVYYSNYGNLDSEIYLPHVIENMHRTDLGSKGEAKARTLRVLFNFVRLSPEEIRELGRDINPSQGKPTPEQIEATAARKREREILLQAASSQLTDKFRDWWKQGNYRLRFQADGDHFRIWVSDDIRTEEIELESRSSGLQWFLSFYLIFLVESTDAHQGAMLLLDEPGLSLHPIAQKDLSAFFENLACTNQLIYTTHSPFLVDADHLDRVKVVYVDDNGTTAVSGNLRASEKHPSQTKSIYPVHAALGLTVSASYLEGCQPVIVEGASDQAYLSAIKLHLTGTGRIRPRREIVFVPAGGVKGVAALAPIIMAKEDELPHVVLDSDALGQSQAKQLVASLYQGAAVRIKLISDLCGLEAAEVEDLFPPAFLARVIARELRLDGPDGDFDELVEPGKPIVPQVKQFAARYNHQLPEGWKVTVAHRAKARLLQSPTAVSENEPCIGWWQELFAWLDATA